MTKVPGTQLLGSLFTNSGTPNVAIGAEDFELLINALASQSRVQVLSNPSVMVENNSEGFIQVGETVRLPDSVSFSAAGQQSSVTAEDVQAVAKKYLDPASMAIFIVGDWGTISNGDPAAPANRPKFSEDGTTHLPLRDPMTMQPMNVAAPASK